MNRGLPLLVLHLLHHHLVATMCSGDDDQFVYSGFAGARLSTDGVAAITPDSMLELTNGTLQRKGHAFHPSPVRLLRAGGGARSFSTSFVFGILSDHAGLSAHGRAIVVAASTDFSAALPSGYLGLLNVRSDGDPRNRLLVSATTTTTRAAASSAT
jgi:hypothetical protein